MNKYEDGEFRQINPEIVWTGKKHHLWFPLSFTKYTVSNGRLYINTGFLSSREDECLLYRITDISLTRTLGQRIFGTGTIDLVTRDHSTPLIRLENVKHPVDVKRMLSNLIEKDQKEKHVFGKDMYGAAGHPDYSDYTDV